MNKIIRKKCLSIILTMTMVMSLFPAVTLPAKAVADTWDGTPDTDWYTSNPTGTFFTIDTAEELAGLAARCNAGDSFAGKTITLAADLVLSGYSWIPISNSNDLTDNYFSGTFDGGKHTITGLNIEASSFTGGQTCGLFGYTGSSAHIKDIILTDLNITNGKTYCAGICGYNYGTIFGCSVSGSILGNTSGTSKNYGGIAGVNAGDIDYCVSSASVTSVNGAGGITGVNNGRIYNCYNTGSIQATESPYSDAGGIVSNNNDSAVVANCYNLGSITGIDTAGGIAGFNQGTVTNCYSAAGVSGTGASGLVNESTGNFSKSYWNSDLFVGSGCITGSLTDCTGKSTADMKAAEFVTLLNDNNETYRSWVAVAGGYPTFAPPNAAPAVTTTGSTTSYTEDGAPVVIDSGITVTDSDHTTLASATVTISGGFQSGDALAFTNDNATTFGNVSGSYNAGTGALTLTSSGATATLAQWQSVLSAVTYANTSQDPTVTNRTISVVVNDGTTSSNTATKAVSVTSVNDAPTFSATATNPTYTENGAAVALFSGTSVSTVESGQTISGLTLTVSNLSDGASEILNVDGTVISGASGTTATNEMSYAASISSGTATITLTKVGGISTAAMQNLINGITYSNSSENPTAGNRVVTLTSITDSGGTANGGVDTTSLATVSTVTIVAVNDTPVLTASGGATAYTENGAPVAIDGSITTSDAENNPLVTATVSITENFQNGADLLAFVNDNATNFGNITPSYNATTGVLTLTSEGTTATIAQWQNALRAVTFSSTADNPGTSKTISFVVNDGSANSAPATKSISITCVNDAPTITAPGSIAVTEDVASALTGISFADIDVGGASVTVTLSVPSGTLSATSGGGVVVGGTASDRTLTGSVSDINAFISGSNLTFTTAANATADVTLSVLVNDSGNTGSGGALTASTTVTLAATAINDAPTITVPGSISVTEDVASALTGISFSDFDAGGASVTVTLSVPSGTLGATSGSGVTVGGTASAITLTGSITDINAYIAASDVTFTTVLNATSSVTLTVTVDDGGNAGTGGAKTATDTVTLTVTPVNDTPTDIGLSSTSVTESAGIGTTVGNLSTTDPDAADTFTYTLVAGDGSADNASFTIDGNALKTNTTFSYATKNSYSIRVKTADAGGLTFEKVFEINITEVNQNPTDIVLSATSINENLGANSTVGTLTTTDANAMDTFTYTLVSGDGSTDNASFNISGNDLRMTGSANFEAKSSYSVRIRTTDAGGLLYEEAFAITISDLNEAPTDITLSASAVNENVAGNTTVGTLSSADPDVGSTFTYSLAAGAGDTDNGAFNIDGSSLRITNSPNYESKSSYSVRVRTTDQGGLSYEEAFTVSINNLNEAPTDIALSASSVNENVVANTTVGTLTSTDPDAGNTFTYTLVAGGGDTDNAVFSIDGSSLKISVSPNFEVKSSYSVRVRATDQGSLIYEKEFAITTNPLNEFPTDITLSANTINENVAGNTEVGTLSSTDPDSGNTFTYTLVAGAGSTDNGSFNISGNSLRLTNSPDYETKNSYSVRVCTEDQGGLIYEKTFTITISDLNEPPTDMALSASAINENVAGNTTVGTLSSTDLDAGSTFTYSLVAGAGSTDNGAFNISGNSLRITNSPNYETKNSYSVRIGTTDQGGLTFEKTFVITINNLNEAPAISTGAAVSVTEGSTAAFTGAAADPEGSAVTWSITGGADQAKFSIVGGTGVVTFVTAPAFGSPTDADTNNSYVLEITASDGALTAMQTVTVTVTQRPSSGGSNTTAPPTNTVVEVNGQKQDAGTASTQTTGGQTVTTIKVDDTKLDKLLASSGEKPTVTLPTNKGSDVVVGELNGQTVKNMEQKEAVLEIRTETVSYTLPAGQINIDDVSSQIGEQVALKDIKVSVKIAEPPADTVKIVENTAAKNSYQIVVKPVEFEITCTSGDKTVAVSKFNGYVERTVAIPDGIDPSKITTGIVLNNDGTFSHVPTQIVVINGKYFAKINSLTNSTYSVIYNPVEFTDVANHWAKTAVNDMGSRMVVTGIGSSTYEPDRSITRAEFAAVVVRALGLRQGTTESSFGDVTLTDWFNGYVDTATAYALITGYDSKAFGPSDTITREQAMAIIGRAIKLTELKVSLTDSEVGTLLSKYTDGSTVSGYAKEGVAVCLKTGIVTGKTANTISPKDYVTRAEVATMVQHLLEKSGLI